MTAQELIDFLQQHPTAKLMFVESIHYSALIDVDLDDFEYKPKINVIVLPNLCCCYPEPD